MNRNHQQGGFSGHIYDHNLREYSKYFLELTSLNSEYFRVVPPHTCMSLKSQRICFKILFIYFNLRQYSTFSLINYYHLVPVV